MPVLAMSLVAWGARRFDVQAGSIEDRIYDEVRALMWDLEAVTGLRDRESWTFEVPLSTRLRAHLLRLAELLRIRMR